MAGLSAACQLAGRGYDVTVVERDSGPGGRSGRLSLGEYQFDTGPTVLTMPQLLEDCFNAVGTELSAALPLTRLDPAYRARYADGSEIFVRAGAEAMTEEVREKCGPGDAAAFEDFVAWLEKLYRLELPNFIDRNLDGVFDLLGRPAAMVQLLSMGGFQRLGNVVQQRFSDERLRRLFSFQAMYAGLAPSDALAIYAVITYMDCIEGVYTTPGGMFAVPSAMAKAAEAAGVQFRYDAEVTRLLRRADGAVAGVELIDGSKVRADVVVATVDAPVLYDSLAPDLKRPSVLTRKVLPAKYSPSCVVWHAGVRGELPATTAHHNIHFGTEWESSFTALIDEGRLMPDPSRFVCAPTLSDPGMAPAGGHSMYVLEPVPNLAVGKVDWQREAGPLRDRLLAFLAEQGYPADVEVEQLVTPLDWERQGMAAGTPFALAHSFFQTGPFRPRNVDPQLPGLVLAGSSTIPGVGVPMVLISGKLAAQRVAAYLP